MKTLLINGSPRKDGNTAVALNEIAKPLETEGCVFDDDAANTLAEKMAEAGAVVVGSPVYYGQPNGALLARPGAVIAVGARDDGPEYDWADGATFRVFEPREGSRVQAHRTGE